MATKKSRPSNFLRAEDRILWEMVAKTATPLPGKQLPRLEAEIKSVEPAPKLAKPAKPTAKPVYPQEKKTKARISAPREMPIYNFDPPTHKKISKGRVDIEARIDLHGLTQSEAYELLYGFLLGAHARGLKHVMVITGKGRSFGSAGILRQAVPHWFSTPIFRLLVSAYEDAARHHGGDGALYVRLRRQTQGGGFSK